MRFYQSRIVDAITEELIWEQKYDELCLAQMCTMQHIEAVYGDVNINNVHAYEKEASLHAFLHDRRLYAVRITAHTQKSKIISLTPYL